MRAHREWCALRDIATRSFTAKWRPWYALFACLLFGLLQAVALRFQNIDLGGITIPVQVMDALPYILTVVILAGFVGKAIPPRAGGEPYVKER